MSNLVSKNPVLRFKLGRKIIKAQGGQRFVQAGKTTLGNKIWADSITGDLYKFNLDPNSTEYVNKFKPGIKSHLGKNYNFYNLFSGRGTINGSDYIRKLTTSLTINPKDDPKVQKYLERLRLQGFTAKPTVQNVSLNQTTNVVTPITKRTITPKQSSIFMGVKAGNAGAFTLTDEQKALLDLNGIKYGTALELQLGLNNYMTSNGINGSILTDNKWGDLSKRALDYVLNRLNLNGSRWFDNKAPGQMILAVPISVPTILSDFKPQIQNVRNNSYNRSQTRQLMRNAGYNPYNFTGALRKALRMYLAGKSTDTSKLAGIDLSKFKF